jgi:hypothetical protein
MSIEHSSDPRLALFGPVHRLAYATAAQAQVAAELRPGVKVSGHICLTP